MKADVEPIRRKSKSKKRFTMYLGLLISVVCIFWVVGSVEKKDVFEHFRNADAGWLLLAVFTMLFSYVGRGLRWPLFFSSSAPSPQDSVRCVFVGFLMNNVLPARIGEFVRAHFGGRVTKLSRAHVLATIAGERLADGLMISLLFAVLFTFGASASERVQGDQLFLVAYMFAFAALMTAVLLYFRHKVFLMLERMNLVMPGHVSTYTLVRIRKFIEGLEPLNEVKRLALISFTSILVWSVELLVYWQVSKAFSQPMSIGGLALFLAAVNFSSMIPSGPGGVGVIEAFSTVALTKIGISPEIALAMVATQHAIQFLVVGVPGLVFFLQMGGRIPEPDDAEELEEDEAISTGRFTDVSSSPVLEESSPDLSEALSDIPYRLYDERSDVEISVVIPAYNEAERLPKTLLAITQYLDTREVKYEVVVVDDGSSDDTVKVVHQMENLNPSVRVLSLPENKGKGCAVRFGVLNTSGRLVLYSDADCSTPIEEIERLEEAIEAGSDIAIGSRAMFSNETDVEALWYRKFIGRTFNGLVNVLVLPGIADTQCGFKLFRGPVAHYVFSKQKSDRFAFDVEVLFLGRKIGLKIAEVAVNWVHAPGSKVNIAKDSLVMLKDILQVRMRDVFGGYSIERNVAQKLRETYLEHRSLQ